MAKHKNLDELVGLFADKLARYGPDSLEANSFLVEHGGDQEFQAVAHSLTRVKKALRGRHGGRDSTANTPSARTVTAG